MIRPWAFAASGIVVLVIANPPIKVLANVPERALLARLAIDSALSREHLDEMPEDHVAAVQRNRSRSTIGNAIVRSPADKLPSLFGDLLR